METYITTVESAVHPASSANQGWKPSQKIATLNNLHQLTVLQKEIAHLREVIGEKNTHIQRVTGEYEFLHAELERQQNRMQAAVKRSDELMRPPMNRANKHTQLLCI